ncbi:hypothetical protein ZOSMA_2G02720 [Zostera marina]|uniref:Uncharacterized protein n=1 Tax=Zostera marina TaxID=29655 RepID=A0A0K9PBC8_ZOSMR|nr:hypothetical protein ZOSMA_2G02720 [Zostera marina]
MDISNRSQRFWEKSNTPQLNVLYDKRYFMKTLNYKTQLFIKAHFSPNVGVLIIV